MIIATSKGQRIYDNTNIYLTDASINLPESLHLYIVSDTELDIQISLSNSDVFQLYTVDVNDNIVVHDNLDENDIVHQVLSTKHVYTINVLCESTIHGDFESLLIITTDGTSISVPLHCKVEGYNEQLSVVLQNMKIFITEEYMQAMYETKYGAADIDVRIYNTKLREYLMNIIQISAMMGTYESLTTILKFFGYGQLLELREYWKSTLSGSYKSTSITNTVLTQIDKSLSGYKKTNQLSLTYQINEQQSIDDDGLPIFVNVLSHTDEVLFKLWTLERILERDFLHLNTHIVDIIGEFQSVIGLELNVILNDVNVLTSNLTEELNESIEVSIESHEIYVQRHNVLTYDEFAFNSGDPDLTRVTNALTGTHSSDYFDILKIIDSTEEIANDYDYLTRYFSNDFGLIQLNITLNSERYQSFKYVVFNESYVKLFESSLKKITEWNNTILFGTKNLGTFKILVYVYDWYGSSSVISTYEEWITVTTKDVDFFVAVYGEGQIEHDFKMWTTFRDTTGITTKNVVDNFSETLDINTWDQVTNTPELAISRLYESDFDMLSTWTNLNQLNSIKLSSMQGLPLNIHGFTYGLWIYDIIGDGTAGMRTVGIKLFQNKPWTTFELEYDGIESAYGFIQKFANALNVSNDEWNNFTFDVHMYSNNPNALISEARPMLRAKSIKNSFKSSHYYLLAQHSWPHSDFTEQVFKHDVRIFSSVDANASFSLITSALDTFLFTLDDVEYSIDDVQIDTISDIVNNLQSIIDTNELKGVVVNSTNDIINIVSTKSFSLTHNSFVLVKDIVRGLDSSKIIKLPVGSDIRLGEPVFAFIDDIKRHDLANITWTLTDAFTNKVITTQKSYAFRWVMSKTGVYTLTLSTTDISGVKSTSKKGVFIVRDFYDLKLEGIGIWAIEVNFVVS